MLVCLRTVSAEAPLPSDYCQRLQQEIQGRKHGFLAGNVAYYVGGFHASWQLKENETIGLTHPFHHDLRSRGVGLRQSRGLNHQDTGLGNDFTGWEFYKDTRVLYGSVVLDGKTHHHPIPNRMYWRPDRMICEYEIDGVAIREEKFIAANDAACSMITSSRPITLRFEGRSFFGRHSLTSTATIEYDAEHNAIHIVEGGTTTCQPETNGSKHIAPIMYQGMSTILTASQSFADQHQFKMGENGERLYEFEVPCDKEGVVLAWAMHDEPHQALLRARRVLREPEKMMFAKTQDMNHQLGMQIPWFRCSDQKFEDIYYYLWSLYLMYYIDVQKGWEMEPHTQTAVNNFLGMHRYDSTFQIKVSAWTADKPRYAYGNVLTWKHLFAAGHYRQSEKGLISLADNKGTTWHSGVYGNELSEHVLGAWQIYQHTGDINFLRECYEGYFRDVFFPGIAPFYSNHFEVAEALIAMARLTDNSDDIPHWKNLVSLDKDQIQRWFAQRWELNGHQDYFAGPKDGMLMTTGFWHARSKHFPRSYASRMTKAWAFDKGRGFFGDFFPLAMSRQAMRQFGSRDDLAFGYTPDTAYFTLSGMFRQRLGSPAWRLTLNHLENYNFHPEWNVPVAPEAYRRDGNLFGDQYSNFNAGKLLLYLEGLAGLEYSIPQRQLIVHDTMPTSWRWMEVRLPIRIPGDEQIHWTVVRYERTQDAGGIAKSIRIRDCPLQIVLEPWSEEKPILDYQSEPAVAHNEKWAAHPHYLRFDHDPQQSAAFLKLQLAGTTDEEN